MRTRACAYARIRARNGLNFISKAEICAVGLYNSALCVGA